MRSLSFLPSFLIVTGCALEAPSANPPLLHVTSPQRSLVQDDAGALVVTGTVAPNPDGAAVASVTVDGVPAALASDGSWTATVQLAPGATLLHTVATDAAGGVATDTRSVEAGARMAPGARIPTAVAASISAAAFAKIGDAAGALIQHADLTALLQPLNPIVHAGDPNGPDCLYGEAYVDSVSLGSATISLVPTTGGLQISAELDHLDVRGHVMYAVACANGHSAFEVSATAATLAGTLALSTGSATGFHAQLASPDVQLTGLAITATGIPGAVLDILPVASIIEAVAPAAAQLFVSPLLDQALGALTGPQKLTVLGKTIDLQVTPSSVAFDPSGGTIGLDMSFLIEGTETSPGFTFTPNGAPVMDPGDGLAVGLADDLANEALAELTATGLLDLALPAMGGPLDARVTATSPPMISADPSDGKLRLVLPDMTLTLSDAGTPVAHAAINAQADVSLAQAAGGSTLAIDLGTPAIALDVLDDTTGGVEVGGAAGSGTAGQLGSIGALLQGIPLPKLAGLTLADTSVTGGGDGYVMVKTTLQ